MAGDLLVINADGPETRVALIEKGQLAELYIERRRERGIVGNIYKGRVKRVLPGMQAAFVDIGVEKAAFLYVADVRGAPEDFKSLFVDSDEERQGRPQVARAAARRASRTWSRRARRSWSRWPRSRSAPRARARRRTCRCRGATWCSCRPSITSASRAASAPTRSASGCATSSSRCGPRARASSCAPSPRACQREGAPDDMEFLVKLWNAILAKQKPVQARRRCSTAISICCCAPCAICSRREVDKLIVDAKTRVRAAAQVRAARSCRDFGGKIELYDGREPIFDGYGIESGDRSRARAQGVAAARAARSSSIRARRSPRSTSTPASSSARSRAGSRRRSPRPTSRRARRSPISCGCATSAASSSSTSSTWTRSSNREQGVRAFEEALKARQGARPTSPRSRELGPRRDDAQAHARVARAAC